jgi:hypothetical protein
VRATRCDCSSIMERTVALSGLRMELDSRLCLEGMITASSGSMHPLNSPFMAETDNWRHVYAVDVAGGAAKPVEGCHFVEKCIGDLALVSVDMD